MFKIDALSFLDDPTKYLGALENSASSTKYLRFFLFLVLLSDIIYVKQNVLWQFGQIVTT